MSIISHNIFYTDDDIDDRDFFVDAVREISDCLQVITHCNGNELMKMLHNPPPTPLFLFLDLNMPVKNGFEVLKEIRAFEHLRNLPIIVFSTSDNEEIVNTTRELGASLYVTKPTSYHALKKIIRHSLSVDWTTFTATREDFLLKIS